MSRLTLKSAQAKVILDCQSRFKVLIAGRRFGKTYGAIASLLIASSQPNKLAWYVAPTYRQAKQICWKKLKAIVPLGVRIRTNETELSIELRNGSVIELKGSDNPDSLRGVGLDHLVLDEFADIQEEAWTEVLRPTLADRQGTGLFIGTPDGYANWSYKLFQRGLKGEPDWQSFQYTSLQGGNIPAEEIESARRDLDERTFRQEFEASFESLSDRVYYVFHRQLNHCDDVIQPSDTLHIGMDFNVGRMCALVIVLRDKLPRAVDELVNLYDTPAMIEAIQTKYPHHKIIIYPDASSKNRKSVDASTSDLTLLKQAGFKIVMDNSNPSIKDRVITVNSAFLNAAGDRRLLVNTIKCPWLTERLEQQTYKNGIPEKDGTEDILDALGYVCVRLIPLKAKSIFFENAAAIL
jgi:hypothetical protein